MLRELREELAARTPEQVAADHHAILTERLPELSRMLDKHVRVAIRVAGED